MYVGRPICYTAKLLAIQSRSKAPSTPATCRSNKSNGNRQHVERNFINIHNTSRDKAYSIHIIHVIRLDDAQSDVSQNMDADDELKLSLSAVVIATIAKKRKKRRQVRSCWVRPWICSRPRFGGYEALLMNVRKVILSYFKH